MGAGGAQFDFQKSNHLQPLASGCERLREAACGCLWLLVAAGVSGCLWLRGRWLQVAASGCKWLQVAASGCKWLQVAASGCKWLQVAASGCKWLQVAASGCKWLQVAASGCKWLRGCLSEQLFSFQVSKLEKGMVLHLSLNFFSRFERARCQVPRNDGVNHH